MKKNVIVALSLLVSLFFSNCTEYDITPTYILKINIEFPDGFTAAEFPDGISVTATNTERGRKTAVTANANGEAVFELARGTYNLTTNFSLIGNDDKEYFFNGTSYNYVLFEEATTKIDLLMAKAGGFVLKEIYYSGSRTTEGKSYYADQFHEVYNNSSDTLYADGLCIAFLEPSSTRASVWINDDGSLMDLLPLTYQTWIVPGDGDDHPVYPGESFVIAQDGIDHQTDENGNSNSPVNLGNADWEAYFETSGKDLDASAVPNLTLVSTTSSKISDWMASVFGPAEIIFRLPDNDWESYVSNANNFMKKPGSSSSIEYLMIDKAYVIDAVECVRIDKDVNKRFPAELDAGYTYIEAGSYSSKSVRRKVKMIFDGQVIYQDTNNSSEDFLHDLDPTPGENPTTVEI